MTRFHFCRCYRRLRNTTIASKSPARCLSGFAHCLYAFLLGSPGVFWAALGSLLGCPVGALGRALASPRGSPGSRLGSLGVSWSLLELAASNTQKQRKTLFTVPEPLGAPKTMLFTRRSHLELPKHCCLLHRSHLALQNQFQAPSGATAA